MTILAMIGAGTGVAVSWASRNKLRAETDKIQLNAADDAEKAISAANQAVVKVALAAVDNLINPLNFRIDQLEAAEKAKDARIDQMEAALEALNGKYMKLQIAYVIACQQMETAGIRPLIALDDLAQMSAHDLRDVAERNGVRWQR